MTEPKEKSLFTQETLVPVGLVLTIAVAAMSFGIMYQKIETLQDRMSEMSMLREDVAQIKTDVAVIKAKVTLSPAVSLK